MPHFSSRFLAARHHRSAGLLRQGSRRGFRSQTPDRFRRWPDENHALPRASRREFRVLAQGAVARMDRVRSMLLRGFEDAILTQVAFGGSGGPNMLRFIGHADMQRAPVGIRKHRDTAYVHLAQGANNAHGDLATIGDQDSP